MSNLTIALNEEQVVDVLVQFSPQQIKNILETLIRRKVFSAPTLEEISKEAEHTVQKEGLKIDVVEEAKAWSRSKR
jgi:hypothetical protein